MIPAARSRGPLTTLITLAVFAATLVGAGTAQAESVTLAWDRSSDATVIGYRVYVGTTSGFYTETFDVGPATTFSYNAREPRTHYFAVASYAAGPVLGPLSREVVATLGSTVPPGGTDESVNFWSSLWNVPARATTRSFAASCWEPLSAACVSVQTIATVDGNVSSLSVAPDGQLFFVEEARRVRTITPAGVADVFIESNPSIALNEIAVDPTFAETGFVWVSETTTRPDGGREFGIARYRVVQNRAGERAAIVAAIPLPESGQALFTIDDSRMLYVTVPSSRDAAGDVYAGNVLRFTAEGRAPGQQNGSPILSTGYLFPTAITIDSTRSTMWLSGSPSPSTASVDLAAAASGQPVAPHLSAHGAATALSIWRHVEGDYLLSLTGEGLIRRAQILAPSVTASAETLRLPAQLAVAVKAGNAGKFYAVVRIASPDGTSTFKVVRVLPQQ